MRPLASDRIGKPPWIEDLGGRHVRKGLNFGRQSELECSRLYCFLEGQESSGVHQLGLRAAALRAVVPGVERNQAGVWFQACTGYELGRNALTEARPETAEYRSLSLAEPG